MKYNLHQCIYFAKDDEELVLHFNWLFRVISLVNKKYIDYTVINGNKTEKQYHKERVFAYELYRQWVKIFWKANVMNLWFKMLNWIK